MAALLLVVAGIARHLAAWRAIRMDPMAALRAGQAGRYRDADAIVTPDGSRLYCSPDRPAGGPPRKAILPAGTR